MAEIECSFGRDDVVRENRYREPILRDGLFSDNDLLATYDCLRAAPDNPGGLFWFPIEKLHKVRAGENDPVEELSGFLGEQFARFFYSYTQKLFFEIIPSDYTEYINGFEFWHINNIRPGRGGSLHIDWDHSFGDYRKSARPVWSTILYVGPLTGLKGGETVVQSGEPDPAVMNACFTNRPAKKLLRLSNKWVMITPKPGRCVIFAGDSPHFVNPLQEVPPGCPRTTLLVNFWLYPPKQFEELRTISWLEPSEIRLLCRIRGDELNLVTEQVYVDLLTASSVRPKVLVVRALMALRRIWRSVRRTIATLPEASLGGREILSSLSDRDRAELFKVVRKLCKRYTSYT
ncbi:MAG: hypothetical protein ACREXR_15000 [Gammaproteobacteria bacterium]